MTKLNRKKKKSVSPKVIRAAYTNITELAKLKRPTTPTEETINNWIKELDTVQFLIFFELWYNKRFKEIDPDIFKSKDLTDGTLNITPAIWERKTNAEGIRVLKGQNGGVYVQPLIAMHFDLFLSPKLNLMVIKTYLRFLDKTGGITTVGVSSEERREYNDAHTNMMESFEMRLHENKVPLQKRIYYRAVFVNYINKLVYGKTAGEWKDQNPFLALRGENIRSNPSAAELKMTTMLSKRADHLLGQRKGFKDIKYDLKISEQNYRVEWPSLFNDGE